MRTLVQDLRYGLRLLMRAPGFTLLAAGVLALGIGALAAVFSLVDALFFRPLPLDEAHNIVNVYGTTGGRLVSMDFSYPAYKYFRNHSRTLSGLAAHYSTSPLNVVVNSDSREVQGAVVSGNYFSLLRVSPLIGRFFLPEEDTQPGRSPVAVVGFYLWQQWLGGQPDVIGKELEIRRALSKSHLYSSAFIVQASREQASDYPTRFKLIGAGWGHGVGLCQIGAAVMADRGHGHEEILAHYFAGVEISALY